MENLDIKAGDYVETKDGLKGYVYSKYPIIGGNCEMGCYFYDIMVNDLYYGKFAEKEMEQNFVRIGKYDFTKKDKIEPLEYNHMEKRKNVRLVHSLNGTCEWECDEPCDIFVKTSNEKIINKINEIIDYINKEE